MSNVCFDAEPLIAYYWDEPGADTVEDWLEDVEAGRRDGYVSTVTCTEVRYVCGRDDPDQARAYINRVRNWFTVIPAEEVWEEAARYKREYGVALGDAFTVATSDALGATAVVGADDDFDAVDDVEFERFRQKGV